MNSNEDPVDYCPYRANVGWGQVQTQDFSKVNYFQASDDELRNGKKATYRACFN